ncbi:hypothetical protein niasHT_036126 [Heterodera trifolii]|uniref:Thiamine pyrophosphate enzyme N-terminal TPP-binding domain-containing protein n=1 Tax=Heterodera trifolii TaxID=157864 RepID=A0ABD2I8F7_9BILA
MGTQQSVLSTTIWDEEAISSNGATRINPAVQRNRKGKQQQYKTNGIRDGHTCAAQITAHKKGDSVQPGKSKTLWENLHGGELVAEVLKAHRVRELFTLCGGHISPILVACEQIVIRVLDMRHETTAVFAADAAARLR